MTVRIAPSMLSADFSRLGEELTSITEAGADLIHLDVMDGHFVPNLTFGPPVIRALRRCTPVPFDCHLMVENPQAYIEQLADAGVEMISIHVEAERHLHRALAKVRERGCKAGVAVNPATSTASLHDVIGFCDYVLLMSVNPGFGGQAFIEAAVGKVREVAGMIASRNLEVSIEVDGGIDSRNAGALARAGADILVAGSSIFSRPDRREAIAALRLASGSLSV